MTDKRIITNKCSSCGLCCTLFLINLSEKEYTSGRFKTIFKNFSGLNNVYFAKKVGANILAQKKDGSCVYLKNKLCSIHKTRPMVCRKFFCTSKSKKYEEMRRIIKEAKKLKFLVRHEK